MKISAVIVAAMLCGLATSSQACVSIIDQRRGDNCNNLNSLSVLVKNYCSQNVRVVICLRESNGQWDCGSDSSLPTNNTHSNFICDAWGSSDIDVRYCDQFGSC